MARGAAEPVSAYARAVAEGRTPASRLTRLACERHLDDLASGPGRGLRFDPQAARHAIEFFGFLRHSKGEWAGQTFALAPWQAFVVGALFGWKRDDGLRRFRTAYCAVPRKNGKSTLSAGIGLYLLVADGEQEEGATMVEFRSWCLTSSPRIHGPAGKSSRSIGRLDRFSTG